MSLIKLYLDEDAMDWSLVKALRLQNIDILTVQEAGTQGYSDDEQLSWATEQRRVLYSHNIGDFCRLHSHWLKIGRNHSGIALIPQNIVIGDQVRGILKLIQSQSEESMKNRLIFLRKFLNI